MPAVTLHTFNKHKFQSKHTSKTHMLIELEMVSMRFVGLCAAGFAGSLFLGYCVYFDKKRRSDPDYKKKVLASELILLVKATRLCTPCLL
jgi:hypothetical protein